MSGTFQKFRFGLTALLVLLVMGCSDLDEKIKKLTAPPQPADPTKPLKSQLNANLAQAENLLSANQGKSVVTGVLKQEGTLPTTMGKVVSNAQGTTRYSTKEMVPLSNAQVLFYDALNPSTLPAGEATTDTAGRYSAAVPEGQYYAFAVKFDPINLQLITARVDNIKAVKDSIIQVIDVTAAEDKIAPTVISIFDAIAPDANNIFLLSGIPNKGTKINISFSEPIQRTAANQIYLGKIDTSSTTFALADTVSNAILDKIWSGDNSVLTLSFKNTELALDTNSQYGILLPMAIKDLAGNALDAVYKATFVPVSANAATAFALTSSTPAEGDSLRPSQTPTLLFNQPVDVFSAMRGISISPIVDGVWEVLGTKVQFRPKSPLVSGNSYTINISTEVKNIQSKPLAAAKTLSFKVGKLTGLAAGTDQKAMVARIVGEMIDAYKQGDITKFSGFFHDNMRFEGNRSKTDFLNQIRSDVEQRNLLAAGYPAPVYDTKSACSKDSYAQRYKVRSIDQPSKPIIWVETQVAAGSNRRVWLDGATPTIIDAAKITWTPFKPELAYDGAHYVYDADFSKFSSSTNQTQMQNDFRFYNDMLRQTSSVVLENVTMKMFEEMLVDENMLISGDTAKAVMKNRTTDSPSRTNYQPGCTSDSSTLTHTSMISMVLIKTGDSWKITYLTSQDLDNKQYQSAVKYDSTFQSFNQIQSTPPLALLQPVNHDELMLAQTSDTGSIVFKFTSIKDAGGYIIGIAEDQKYVSNRGRYGLLLFTRHLPKSATETDVNFKLTRKTNVIEGNTVTSKILRNPRELNLPGWDRQNYDQPLDELVNYNRGLSGAYLWKVIAVKDTSAAQFLNNGFKMERFLGESDFYKGLEFGSFATTHYPDQMEIELIMRNQQPFNTGSNTGTVTSPTQNNFSDMDQDRYPDAMEIKYLTDMRNASSYPEFSIDTDKDGLPDFLEQLVQKKKGLSINLAETFDSNATATRQYIIDSLKIPLIDTDKDNFPDDIEEMQGFNSRDPMNNPGYKARPTLPTGSFKGKMQIGADRFDFSVDLIKTGESDVYARYISYVRGDTLKDSVHAFFNMMAGEFVFPIRIKTGPNAGQSYLLRGFYDNNGGLLKGPVDLVQSVPTNINAFPGGPSVGQFVAGSKADFNADLYLGGSNTNNPTNPTTNPVNPTPINMMYRSPPAGVTESWSFTFKVVGGQPELIISEAADTLAHFRRFSSANGNFKSNGRMDIYMQPDGSYNANGEISMDSTWKGERVMVNGRLAKGTDGTANVWVFDGTIHEEIRRCAQFDASSNCISQIFEPKDADYSSRIPVNEMSWEGTNPKGTLKGWVKKQEFFNVNPYVGTPAQFNKFLLDKGITEGSEFYIKVTPTEKVYTVKFDTNSIVRSYKPECGSPSFIRMIPSNDAERKYTYIPNATSSISSIQLLALESRPGVPQFIDDVKDDKGVSLGKIGFVVTERPLQGMQCPEQNVNQPTNPVIKSDLDGDCVEDQFDINPTNRDVPMVGGQCGAADPTIIFYKGTNDLVRSALTASGGNAWLRDATGATNSTINLSITPNLSFDNMRMFVVISDTLTKSQYGLLALMSNPNQLQIKDGKPIVMNLGSTVQQPTGTDKDGDCVFTPGDPDDNNKDIPKVGGSCVTQPVDMDMDCVPAANDPNDNNKDIPTVGGMCNTQTGTDKDGDCVFTPGDPDDNNKDIPKVGGSCTTQPVDMDMDCVPAANDPNDNNKDIPTVGGQCATQSVDRDGDCIYTPTDFNDNDPNVPVVGGQCPTQPKDLPLQYMGNASSFKTELANKGVLSKLNIINDNVEISYVLAADMTATNGGNPMMYMTTQPFSAFYNVGASPSPIRIKINHLNIPHEFSVIVTDDSLAPVGSPMIKNGKFILVESLVYLK